MRIYILFFAILFCFFSCDLSLTKTNGNEDCMFVQNDSDKDGEIDDDERAYMDDCRENAYDSKSDIEENLIGEWKLIGHGEGWVPTISQPCAYLTISDEELILDVETADLDSETTHTWEIEEIDYSGGTYFRLAVDPQPPTHLFFTNFSEEYMFMDATPLDGNMYLYEKVD